MPLPALVPRNTQSLGSKSLEMFTRRIMFLLLRSVRTVNVSRGYATGRRLSVFKCM